MSDDVDESDESPRERVRSWEEHEFRPHLTVEVPRATWERVCEIAAPGRDPDDIAPFSPGREHTEIEQEIFNYFIPTYEYIIADEDESEDGDSQHGD